MAAPQLSDRLADPRFGRVLGVLAKHRGGNSASVAWQERVAGDVLDELDSEAAAEHMADRRGNMDWADETEPDQHGFTANGIYE